MRTHPASRSLLRLCGLLLLVAPLAAQTSLTVQSATPTALRLEKGGSATLTLQGTGLGAITGAALTTTGKLAVNGVTATVLPLPPALTASRTLESRTLKLTARWDAPEGEGYRLQVVANGQVTILPEAILTVTVVWPRPQVSSCPAAAPVGSVISIRGTGFGHAGERDRTKVVLSYLVTYNVDTFYGEIVSLTPTEIKVRVPRGARHSKPAVVTPGGVAYAPATFAPQYISHFTPDSFQPAGQWGSVLHLTESYFALAHGTNNSMFNPSSAMSLLGFPQVPFTFPPRDQRIDLAVASTIFRVRLKGTNRLSATESLRTTAFGVTLSGTDIVINLAFEKEGTEFIGEYETQDVLSGKIYWKHCLNLEADDLKVSVTLPISTTKTWLRYQFVSIGAIKASASFNSRFSVLGSPPFPIPEGPILDYVKTDAERSIGNALNSDFFKKKLNEALTASVRMLFQGSPVVSVQAQKAADGGLDFVGYTY